MNTHYILTKHSNIFFKRLLLGLAMVLMGLPAMRAQISGGVVTLDDREEHSWSYYSDASLPVNLHSLNPADVKITYYGNGNNVSTSNDASPALNTFTASSINGNNKVKVGIDADADVFIYFKTLERTDGGTSANPTGRCAYTTIPNPFSVRPTYGSGDTRWRGFYAWRVKTLTGGAIYDAATGGNQITVGGTINAEQTVYFAPTSEYSMQVELEALWARAYLYTGSGNVNLNNTVTYERNFVIGGAAVNYNATYSSIYPNGTTNGNTTATMNNLSTYNAGTRSLNYDTKFEYISLTGGTYTANNHYLCFGRGISTDNTAASMVQGINANVDANTTLNYTIRIESGKYAELSFVKSSTQTVSGRYYVKSILGCDYDRATNTNNLLSISAGAQLFYSQQVTFRSNTNRDAKTFDLVVKSGEYQRNYWSNQNGSGGGGYRNSFYCGQNQGNANNYHNYPGVRYVVVEGGEMGCLNGGRGTDGAKGTYAPSSDETPTFTARIKGGLIHGAVFGGAADSDSPGSRAVIVTGGTIEGWIAAGANGTGSSGGTNSARSDGNSYIYVGGDALVGGSNVKTVNQTVGGQVFGAGRGQNGQEASINNSNVVIADEAVISGTGGGYVYGGGYTGYVKIVSNVYVVGGTVENSVFGGAYGNGNTMDEINVTMKGGLVKNGVYGGSNSTGNVTDVTMNINGGTVGDGQNGDGVFGGGYGSSTRVIGSVNLTVGDNNATEGVTVNGDVYGGSAEGRTNCNAAGNAQTAGAVTNVTLNAGTINGSLYGGGLGAAGIEANVYGPVQVTVNGGSVNTTSVSGSGAVYGCNNVNGAPQSTVKVDVYGTDPAPDADHFALDAVYGGGNQAAYGGTPVVKIHNCDNSIGYVYGGGNAAAVNATDLTVYGGNKIGYVFGGGNGTAVSPSFVMVTGAASTKIYGGTILHVFAGNNSNGLINGAVKLKIDKQPESGHSSCPMKIGEVYGGGNLAAGKAGTIDIDCTGTWTTGTGATHENHNDTDNRIGYELEGIGTVYGGANQAAISNNITLNINSGIVANVFGGNNHSGTINGKIQVNINKNTDACDWYVGNVFGGGNEADYGDTPDVNIQAGTVSGSVFGGGNQAGVGGGDVAMTGGAVLTGIYGGCNTSGTVIGAISVKIDGGIVGAIGSGNAAYGVYGGGYGTSTATGDAVTVTIGGSDGIEPVIYGDVYGGSAKGNVNDAISEITKVWLKKGTVYGDIYGGGFGDGGANALVNGTVQVVVDGGSVNANNGSGGRVFGCNNAAGTPKGPVSVTINHTNPTTTVGGNKVYALQGVYGGGNLAAYVPTNTNAVSTVVVNDCASSIKDLYGGGNAAPVPGTDVTINGGDINRAFAGGNGESGTPAHVGYNTTDLTPSNNYGTGVATMLITDGTINQAFGGSNSNGNIRTSANVTVERGTTTCGLHITELYGGGNEAAGKAGTLTIGCTGSTSEGIDYVYGGANKADVEGDITLNITGGRINNAFGGNNTSGTIDGDIVVNVVWGDACTNNYLGNVYGGGNLAAYTQNTDNHPQVNIKNGTVSNNVYGGGKGTTAVVTGNPVVTIGDVTNANYSAIVEGNVFGGGDAAAVEGNASVTYNDNNSKSYVGKLFGGGNAANVSGSTTVTLTQGKVNQGVYGGCNDTGSVGEVTLNLNGGTVGEADPDPIPNLVFGGGYGHPTTTTSDINVNLSGTTVYGNLYGGSALGSVNFDANNKTTVTLASATLYGSVFGGGMGSGDDHKATSLGHAIVNINVANTNLKGIYGGANVNGNVAGDIDVNVKANVGTTGEGNKLDIFGGGYGQHTTTGGDVTVTVDNATTPPVIYGDIYGGSALGKVNASSKLTKVNFKNGTLNGVIYGGGMGNSTTAAMVYGNTEVAVAAGSISGGIYGGCNKNGTVEGNITVGLTGGTVGTSGSRCDVFGGGLGASTQTKGHVTVNFGSQSGTATAPAIYGDVYGGSSLGSVNDAASDKTIVNILSGSITGNVYGGGMGQSGAANVAKGKVNGEVVVNIGKKDGDNYYGNASFNTYTVDTNTLGGSVYGCNNTNGSPQDKVTVNVYQTAHTTTPTNNTTSATGNDFTNFAINQVFGGGRQADYTATGQKATVNIFTCDNTVKRVFGGGDAAAVPGTKVTIDGGRFDYVFGGGNGEAVAANIGAGGINLTLHGGKINHLFSGSNTSGTIGGPMNVMIDNEGGCDELIGEFFGGSNMVQIGTAENPVNITTTLDCGVGTFTGVYGGSNMAAIYGNVTLNIKGGTITNAFGGSKGVLNGTAANITGNVTLNLYGGTITNAFGGSDQNGNITGQITLNVLDFETNNCGLDVTNLYGGGNLTPYEPTTATLASPAVNVMHIKQDPGVRGDVYGGGLGATAIVKSNPVVKIGYDASTMSSLIPTTGYTQPATGFPRAKVTGNVYGGGSLAAVTGSTSVLVQTSNTSILSNVFGGGRGEGDAGAGVSGSTQVQMTAGSVAGALYGGCNYKGTVSNGTMVNMSGGTTGYVYGGGLGENTIVNKSTATYGSSVTLSGNASVTNDVYGGGNAGVVNGGTNVKLTE